MRAKIVDNLLETIVEFFGEEEGHRNNAEFIALAERISAKEVDLVFTAGEAFDAIDNSHWLPDCCWTAI